jgi:hypothetical protein
VSRTPAAQLARLRCTYPLWAIARVGDVCIARTRDEFGLVALIRDTPGALEADMMTREYSRKKKGESSRRV